VRVGICLPSGFILQGGEEHFNNLGLFNYKHAYIIIKTHLIHYPDIIVPMKKAASGFAGQLFVSQLEFTIRRHSV
jgi:hypothetical protein